MKKRLLTLGALALAFSASAQITSYIGDKALVSVNNKALVYNGGGLKTVESGKVENSGNIMVVGNASSKFVTVAKSGATETNKTDGGNIIMKMTNEDVKSLQYGQLYIRGLAQNNITGVVDKEYKDVAHGTYQQIALPFKGKVLSELSRELGKTFEDKRWSKNEVLVYNNALVRSDLVKITEQTSNPIAYYMLGATGISVDVSKNTIKGVPYADGISIRLKDAGNGINFGVNGSNPNVYRERYNSYLQDAWAHASGKVWIGDYGKNIYQFGNPFLTNLDLGHLGKTITNLQGVRIEPQNVTTVGRGATYSSSAKYVNYTADGVAVGDNNAIIRPMQTFVIKLKDNVDMTLNFDDLRRFAYTPRKKDVAYKVTESLLSQGGSEDLIVMSSKSSESNLISSSTVKQLGVIALDVKGNEIGRTYYVVYEDGISGKPERLTTQTIASSQNVIGTFEEAKKGGLDEELATSYWLYINEANENDFKGKEIPLRLYSDDIKSLRFEIKENAFEIKDGQEKLSSGESFYINLGDKNIVAVNHGQTIPLSSTGAEFGLYYGKPEIENIATPSNLVKPSETFVAFDTQDNNYKLIFDSTWKLANVQVFDMSGRLILSRNNVNTENKFIIDLPASKGVYIVNATSETGHKFSQKVVK